MSSGLKDYQRQQQALAAHIRNPAINPAPSDIEDRRMAIYRDLFFNNIESFIASTFPVFKSLFNDDDWQALVRLFMASYQCQTPYFLEISQEFLSFLENPELEVHQRFPFAQELCHYEWVELAIDISEEEANPAGNSFDANADLLKHPVIVSSLAWPLVYQWPVHLIGNAHIPTEQPAEPTCLVVYRARCGAIEFMQANALTLRLIEVLDQAPYPTGQNALEQLATEMGQPAQSLITFGVEILEQLKALGIILAARVPS
jgi:hypothetical protein